MTISHRRPGRRWLGLALIVVGGYLALAPHVVGDLLDRPATTSSELINLRASWGGVVVGLGAFVAWLPAWRPRWRVAVGLLLWVMAGVGLARSYGFVADGDPDRRQLVWLGGEVALVVGCAVALVRTRRR